MEDQSKTTEFINPLVRASEIELREYQLNIAKRAVKENTLVVLPTALGKTVIAALVASHFLYNHSHMKVLIMAPTRPLAVQHRNTFIRLLRIRPEDVKLLTGKQSPQTRFKAWKGNARVFIATPQVIENDHDSGLRLDIFSLMIFDECHRARKNYSYTKVAKAYVNESPHPIIMGLTASPGADRDKIKEICDALFIEHIEARTEEDPDVAPYISRVSVQWITVPLPPEYQEISRKVRESLDARLGKLSAMGVIKKPPKYIFRTDLIETSDKLRKMLHTVPPNRRGPLFGAISVLSSALSLYHALELLESQGANALYAFLKRIKESGRRGHSGIVSELASKGIYGFLESGEVGEHPKVELACGIISEQLRSSPMSRVILFTQYRDTAAHLVSRLSAAGIRAERFVGQATREGDIGLSQDEQAEILRRFSSGEISVLVATSIGEEGLDIPSVDLVVFYEPVPSEIRYIQRKGRTGRRRFGKVVILAADGTVDVAYLHASRKMAEKMRRVIKSLNSDLKPILRTAALETKIMPKELLEDADKCLQDLGQDSEFDSESETLDEVEMRNMSRSVLDLVLASGREGISSEALREKLASEGHDISTFEAAISKLKEECQVDIRGDMIFPARSLHVGEVHEFEVERVVPGGAILVVDSRLRAELAAEDYYGPRMLIRKGRKFVGVSELRRQDGKIHARIFSIEKVLC
ncbi:MAG: helicase-related protein [Candidatus Hadarchaeales archaeon]